MRTNIFGATCRPGLQGHKQPDILFPKLGRHAKSRSVFHIRMRQSALLHLKARHHFALYPDTLRLPVTKVKTAILVEPTDIAGVEPQVPARLQCLLGHADIPVRHHPGLTRTNHDFTIGIGRKPVVVLIDDRKLEMRQHDTAIMIPLRYHDPSRVSGAVAAPGIK